MSLDCLKYLGFVHCFLDITTKDIFDKQVSLVCYTVESEPKLARPDQNEGWKYMRMILAELLVFGCQEVIVGR